VTHDLNHWAPRPIYNYDLGGPEIGIVQFLDLGFNNYMAQPDPFLAIQCSNYVEDAYCVKTHYPNDQDHCQTKIDIRNGARNIYVKVALFEKQTQQYGHFSEVATLRCSNMPDA
jgi:hypothetical protein